jgi:hypothetical protein
LTFGLLALVFFTFPSASGSIPSIDRSAMYAGMDMNSPFYFGANAKVRQDLAGPDVPAALYC